MGPLTAANLRPPLAVSSRVYQVPALLWPLGVASLCGTKIPGGWGASPWIAEATEVGRGTPGGGHAKRPKQTRQRSYARAAQKGVRVAIVCEG